MPFCNTIRLYMYFVPFIHYILIRNLKSNTQWLLISAVLCIISSKFYKLRKRCVHNPSTVCWDTRSSSWCSRLCTDTLSHHWTRCRSLSRDGTSVKCWQCSYLQREPRGCDGILDTLQTMLARICSSIQHFVHSDGHFDGWSQPPCPLQSP